MGPSAAAAAAAGTAAGTGTGTAGTAASAAAAEAEVPPGRMMMRRTRITMAGRTWGRGPGGATKEVGRAPSCP